ncbi:DUF2637 domain-containing protein [Actinospica robiniae]|uniref:DUF2637 domain-containing protein n=1 Tax=Actinospica robiniae TaxID=304901 RepID=UPI0004231755|nr:DUF2637 domain-containing protein [Actinospica robiniae]
MSTTTYEAAPAPINGHRFDRSPPFTELDPTPPPDRAASRLSGGWTVLTAITGLLAVYLALGGMTLSFRAVSAEMRPAFGAWAWLVPVVADLSVLVFSGVDLVLEKLDMPHPLARWTVYGATFGTVYLNYTAGGDAAGRVAHVLMPSIWVVFIELMRHIVRRRVSLETGRRRDPIPAARWFLAPWPTAKLWRRMVLWRINSYTAALAAERRRLAAIAVVRETHGRAWRWRVSPLLRMQIAMGELGAEQLNAQITDRSDGHNSGQETAMDSADDGQGDSQESAKPRPKRRPSRGQSTAEKVAKLTATHPDWSAAQVAEKLEIGERTARRYMTGK